MHGAGFSSRHAGIADSAMARINADIIIAALLLVFSGVLFADTFAFQTPPLHTFSIRTWPRNDCWSSVPNRHPDGPSRPP